MSLLIIDKKYQRSFRLFNFLLLIPFLLLSRTFVLANDLFPKPYIDKDLGLGKGKHRFTFNESKIFPEGVSFALQQRTRFESLNKQFRSETTGSDQVLSLRTLIQVALKLSPSFKVQLELQDSRTALEDAGTSMSTSIVNSGELLEANMQWLKKNIFQSNGRSILRIGRITMDFGKRRLISRNRFRNTKNAFTGLDWIWKASNGNIIRAIYTLPVERQPNTRQDLLLNKSSFDYESFDRILWGFFISRKHLPFGDKGEVYIFGLHENDGSDSFTRDRKLFSTGFRLYRAGEKGQLDYEWESIVQFGKSRRFISVMDAKDMNHLAHFHHAELGYTFSAKWLPKLIFAYDYASGDSKPNDNKNERFDTLFGATVFDYGPTSIHRAFVRSNISGPGVKFIVHPHKHFSTYFHYRAFWLASDTDIWAGNSGLRDKTGNSDNFLGQQFFLRGKWQVMANVQLECGLTYRVNGSFQNTSSESQDRGDVVYSYISVTLSF